MTHRTPTLTDADGELSSELYSFLYDSSGAHGDTRADELEWLAEATALIQAHTSNAVLEARIDTAQFSQNLVRDALAVDADTRKISRFGAVDEVLERFISELEALEQGPTNAKRT